jgi:uncharacterized protein YigE (DUF2233 family)
MRKLTRSRGLLWTLALIAAQVRPAVALDSRLLHSDEGDYRVVTVDLVHDALELYWRDGDSRPYGSIDALRRNSEAQGRRELLFATNAGIYDREFRPLGLTIADGRTLRPVNSARGNARSGNFGMQPNGIFYVDASGHAGVMPTAQWLERGIQTRTATQSGPMLVIDGEINPNFIENSDSRKWRSGVCAAAPDRAVFAVSTVPVTFHAFARVFRDELHCRDALYLDGTLSQIYTAAEGYSGAPAVMLRPYAGMFAVFADTPASK